MEKLNKTTKWLLAAIGVLFLLSIILRAKLIVFTLFGTIGLTTVLVVVALILSLKNKENKKETEIDEKN